MTEDPLSKNSQSTDSQSSSEGETRTPRKRVKKVVKKAPKKNPPRRSKRAATTTVNEASIPLEEYLASLLLENKQLKETLKKERKQKEILIQRLSEAEEALVMAQQK